MKKILAIAVALSSLASMNAFAEQNSSAYNIGSSQQKIKTYDPEANKNIIGYSGYTVKISEAIANEVNNQRGLKTPVLDFSPDTKILSIAENSAIAKDMTSAEPMVFYGYKGDTLRNTIDRWAREAGYTIVWDTDIDFTLDQDFTLQGTLTSPNGPLDKVFESLESTGSPIRAIVKKNKAIVIKKAAFTSQFLIPENQ